MYEKFYNLTGKPFQLNPDPRFFFKSKGHLRAMAYLRYGLQQGQGFIVVTGDIGTGKTMLVNNLFREIESHNVVAAKVVSTNVKEHDLLRLLAADFNLPYEKLSKAALLLKLEEFFRGCVDEGKRVLLVIDEAQNLPRSSLEELRMLSNFDYKGQPLVQSFLLGQREFRSALRSQGLEQLRQRIIAAYHLKPLSAEEVHYYVTHRLHKVGWQDDPRFDDEVFAEIFRFTGGVPRRINTLMDRLLLHACLEQTHGIAVEELRLVTSEIDAEQGGRDPEPQDVRLEPIGAEDRGAAVPHAPAPAHGQADLQRLEDKLEQRLAQVQQAVNRISVTLQAPPPPPPAHHEMIEERPFPFWTVSFGAAVVLMLLAAGVVFYFFLLAPT